MNTTEKINTLLELEDMGIIKLDKNMSILELINLVELILNKESLVNKNLLIKRLQTEINKTIWLDNITDYRNLYVIDLSSDNSFYKTWMLLSNNDSYDYRTFNFLFKIKDSLGLEI